MDRPHFGSDASGALNEASKTYKSDPTLETYVRLRRSDPAAEIEIRVIGSIESMFYMREEFERYGIDPDLLGGLLDADQQAIEEIALRVMEAMIDGRDRESAGETQLASRGESIPMKLVDWIIACALDGLSWNDSLTIPRDLIVLIRERLGGSKPLYEKIGDVREMKTSASLIAGQLKAQGKKPTLKLVGTIIGVAPSTVMRWFEPGEFETAAERWSLLFDEAGALRPLFSPAPDVASDS